MTGLHGVGTDISHFGTGVAHDVEAGISHLFPPAPSVLAAQSPSAPGHPQPSAGLAPHAVAHPGQTGAPMAHPAGVPGSSTPVGIDKPTSYYDGQLNQFLDPFYKMYPKEAGPWGDVLQHMSDTDVVKYRGMLMQSSQGHLRDINNQLQALKAAGKTPDKKLQWFRKYYQARVAFDQIIGTMPGDTHGLKNCAVGAQQALWLSGIPWGNIGHSALAFGMRDYVETHSHLWRKVATPEPGDLIIIKWRGGSGHVAIYMGHNMAFQADDGDLSKIYMEQAKYRGYEEQGAQYQYYRYIGPREQRTPGEPYPWPRGNWIGYRDQHSKPTDHPAGHYGVNSDNVLGGNAGGGGHAHGAGGSHPAAHPAGSPTPAHGTSPAGQHVAPNRMMSQAQAAAHQLNVERLAAVPNLHLRQPLVPIVSHWARVYNVPEYQIWRIIRKESHGDPTLISPAKAIGVMQLEPGTAAQYGATDPRDRNQNVSAGVRYYAHLLKEFGGNQKIAMAAYNAGEGNVIHYGGVPPFRETQKYVQDVPGSDQLTPEEMARFHGGNHRQR